MAEYLNQRNGRLVMDGLYLQALDLMRDIEAANYWRGEPLNSATERVVRSCHRAALAVGVNPAHIREYGFLAKLELDLEI